MGRIFFASFAGIAPSSVAPFIAAQIVGGFVGAALVLALYSDVGQTADDVVVPRPKTME